MAELTSMNLHLFLTPSNNFSAPQTDSSINTFPNKVFTTLPTNFEIESLRSFQALGQYLRLPHKMTNKLTMASQSNTRLHHPSQWKSSLLVLLSTCLLSTMAAPYMSLDMKRPRICTQLQSPKESRLDIVYEFPGEF